MSASTELRVASHTDVGRVRQRNEDALFAGTTVFAVADGLGGHRAGNIASSLAIESIAVLEDLPPKEAAKRLTAAVKSGNRAVHDRARNDADVKGMGTTMTAVVVSDGVAHLAHVGDSRCYLIRGAGITRISRDHTLVARMVDEGKLTPEQAEQHPQRSVLTRALGADSDVDVEEVRVSLVGGDRLLLCSDGLTGVVSDDEIHAIVSDGADLDEIAQRLIDTANERGGPDNISVVVVDVGGSIPDARAAGRIPGATRAAARRIPVRAMVWVGVLIIAIVGGMLGLRAWADRSYYVGVDDDGTVAIYRGIPVDVPGISLSTLEEQTDLPVSDVKNPAVRRSLDEGVRLPSLADAEAYVEQLRADAATTGAAPLPGSSPSTSASPSPSPGASP